MGVVGLLVLWLLDTLRERSLPGEEMEAGLGKVELVPLSSNAAREDTGTGEPWSNLTSRLDLSGVAPLGRLPLLLVLL